MYTMEISLLVLGTLGIDSCEIHLRICSGHGKSESKEYSGCNRDF